MFKTLSPLFALTLAAQTPAPPVPAPSRPMTMPGRPAAMAAMAPEPKDTDVLATLGKRTLTYGDFVKWLNLMAGSKAEGVRRNPQARVNAQKQYLELQVLAAKGRKDKLETTPAYKALSAALQQQAYAKLLLDEDAAGSPAHKAKVEAENPTQDEIQAYFQANADRFASPEKFSARHLLVSLKGKDGKAITDDEAKAKIAKIQAELKGGKKLEDLAKEYSDDPGSKDKGGLYTDIPYGRFAKEFEDAVRKQEIGAVGEPVKTTFGYHLIQVVSRTAKEPAVLDKVKDRVLQQMLPERKTKAREAVLAKIRAEVGYKEVAPAPAPTPAAAPAPAAMRMPPPAAAPAPAVAPAPAAAPAPAPAPAPKP